MQNACPSCTHPVEPGAKFCPGCGARLNFPRHEADPMLGRVLLGRYRIRGLIGEGGMGKVYLAEQRIGMTTRHVAIKTLRPELSGNAHVAGRFLRECEIVSQLHHPNTVQFFDFGELDGGELFIVMEHLNGEDLGSILEREGPLELKRIDRLLIQIAGSLYEAHQLGVVHRDLKPDNILLLERAGQPDFVKVLDFGIARHAPSAGSGDEAAERTKLTMQGMVLGTPPYMSPEQFRDDELDARSDLYSLGVILYEMLTGRLPFEAKTPWEWANRHLSEPPLGLEQLERGRALPNHRQDAVMRALSKSADDRQSDVMELLEEFTGVQNGRDGWLLMAKSSLSLGAAGDSREATSSLSSSAPTQAPEEASARQAQPVNAPTSVAFFDGIYGDDDDDDDDDEIAPLIEPLGAPTRLKRLLLLVALCAAALFAFMFDAHRLFSGAGGALDDPSGDRAERVTSSTSSVARPDRLDAADENGSAVRPLPTREEDAIEESARGRREGAKAKRPQPRGAQSRTSNNRHVSQRPRGAARENATSARSTAPRAAAAEAEASVERPPPNQPLEAVRLGDITRTESAASALSARSALTTSDNAERLARGEAILDEARSAMRAGRLSEASSRLNDAIRILGEIPPIEAVRSELSRLGERAVGNDLMRGRCEEAQSLFQALRRANAHRASAGQFTGQWCPRP